MRRVLLTIALIARSSAFVTQHADRAAWWAPCGRAASWASPLVRRATTVAAAPSRRGRAPARLRSSAADSIELTETERELMRLRTARDDRAKALVAAEVALREAQSAADTAAVRAQSLAAAEVDDGGEPGAFGFGYLSKSAGVYNNQRIERGDGRPAPSAVALARENFAREIAEMFKAMFGAGDDAAEAEAGPGAALEASRRAALDELVLSNQASDMCCLFFTCLPTQSV